MIKKTRKNRTFILAVLMMLLYPSLWSVPAYRKPITVTQPDGSTITVRLYGDEYFSYRTTADGYLLTEDAKGYLDYAKIDNNGLITTLKCTRK